MQQHFVYIARCSDNTLYTGYTINLKAREATHNSGQGARYTRGRVPIKIVYHEVYTSKSEALKREYVIKQLTKPAKEKLIG